MTRLFSLLILLLVLLPNLMFFRTQPDTNEKSEKDARGSSFLTILEGIGRISVFAIPIFYTISINGYVEVMALVGMALMLGLYYYGWIRYFTRERNNYYLLAPIFSIPVPLATSPVFYFIFASVILHSPLLFIGAVILGVSHIPLSMKEYKLIKKI